MISSGSTVFFFDFDIFSIEPISIGAPVSHAESLARRALRLEAHVARQHPAAVRVPVGLVHHHALREQAGEGLVDARVTGLLHGAGEEARIEQVQDRVLDAADILVDRQPAHPRFPGPSGDRSRVGSVKRAKYQDESTKVSMVSVSRRAGLPHCGQATCFQVGWRSSGLPGTSNDTSSGSDNRQLVLRHRHDAAGLAMDDRDRAAPVALARDAPVAQAEIHLALGDRPVAADLTFETPAQPPPWPPRWSCRRGSAS